MTPKLFDLKHPRNPDVEDLPEDYASRDEWDTEMRWRAEVDLDSDWHEQVY